VTIFFPSWWFTKPHCECVIQPSKKELETAHASNSCISHTQPESKTGPCEKISSCENHHKELLNLIVA